MDKEYNLSTEEIELLHEVILKRQPELSLVIDHLGKTPLTNDNRNALEDVLSDELTATGFDQNWSLNKRGNMLENLIYYILEVAK